MHLYLTESSAVLGMQATAEAERAYWLNREKAAVKSMRGDEEKTKCTH